MDPDKTDTAARFAEIARELRSEPDLPRTLERVVALAVRAIEGCDYCAVSLVHARQRIEVAAASDELAARLDQLQYELREGPCFDAIWEHESFQVDDLANDPRWPNWAPRAAEEGLRSMLSFRLFTDDDNLGALNFYSRTPTAFDADARTVGLVFAAHAAVALSAAQKIQGLSSAIETRNVIGQAQGILMERHKLNADQAFEVLRRASQEANIKLREVALRLIETGE